jgi:hypothetical protein
VTIYCTARSVTIYCTARYVTIYCTARYVTIYCTARSVTIYCTARSVTIYCTALYATLYCTARSVTIYAPANATNCHPRGHSSGLDIALASGGLLSTPQNIPTLSSDHNPVVCKIRNTPKIQKQRPQYAYQYANWTHCRLTLDHFLNNQTQIHDAQDIDTTIHFFTASVLLAVDASIPKRSDNTRRLHIPPAIRAPMKVRNYFRLRYQRTRHIVFYGGLNLLNRVIAKQSAEHRNAKCAFFYGRYIPTTHLHGK